MSKAETSDITIAPEAETYPDTDLETAAADLKSTIEVMRHMSVSPSVVSSEAWSLVVHTADAIADRYQAAYEAVWDQTHSERKVHAAELAALKAEREPLGSIGDLRQAEALKSLMRSAATSVLRMLEPPSTPEVPASAEQGSPDAELLALHAQLTEQTDLIRRIVTTRLPPGGASPESEAQEAALSVALDDWHDTLGDIAEITPTTLAGFHAKADAVRVAFLSVSGAGIGEGADDPPEDAKWHDALAWNFACEVMAWKPPIAAEEDVRSAPTVAIERTVARPADTPADTGQAIVGETSPDAELLRLYLAFLHAHADQRGINLSAYFISGPKENEAYDEAGDVAHDDWWGLVDKIRNTPATTLAGLRAKADAMRMVLEGTVMIKAGSTIADMGDDQEAEERFAWSLARDVIGVTTSQAAGEALEAAAFRDRELIGLCERLVEIDTTEATLLATIEDEDACNAALEPTSQEFEKIRERLFHMDRPVTLKGAKAVALAANRWVDRTPGGPGGVPLAGDVGEWLSLAACAYLADSATPGDKRSAGAEVRSEQTLK